MTEVKVKIPKLNADDITGAAQTTAHELGHYIDLLMRTDSVRCDNWISTTGNIGNAIEESRNGISDTITMMFNKANIRCSEIRAEVNSKYKDIIAKYKEDNADVVANMFSDYKAYKKYQQGLKKLYTECEDVIDYTVRNELRGVNSLQDIYDALSAGKYRDNGIVKYGHGSRYYKSKESQIHEIWANYCALSLTRPDLIKSLKKDKPKLVAALEEIKSEILKRVGEM